MDKNKRNTSPNTVISIILYVFAGLTTIYGVWSFTFCWGDVAAALEQGMTFSGSEFDIISYCVESTFLYFSFATVFFVLGWMLMQQGKNHSEISAPVAEISSEISSEASDVSNEEDENENDNSDSDNDNNSGGDDDMYFENREKNE